MKDIEAFVDDSKEGPGTNSVALAWERQENETLKAFCAFRYYRDLTKDRSIDSAWRASEADRGNPPKQDVRAPKHWSRLSARFHWVARVEAYDRERDGKLLAAREAKRLELERLRLDFEFKAQADVEQLDRVLTEQLQEELQLTNSDVEEITFDTNGRATNRRKCRGRRMENLVKLIKLLLEVKAVGAHGFLGIAGGPTKGGKLIQPGGSKESGGSSEPQEFIWSLTEWPDEQKDEPEETIS